MSQIPREMKICWQKCIYYQSISQASRFGVKSAAQRSLSQFSPFAEIVGVLLWNEPTYCKRGREAPQMKGFTLLDLVWFLENISSPGIIKKLQFMGTNRINALCSL